MKILEKVFFYLMEERAKFFSDDKKREKYLELQEEIKKQKRSENLENKAENEAKRIYLRDKAIMLKSNELKIIPYKRDDPYSFYFKKKKVNELIKEKKSKTEESNRINLILDNEILF